MSRRKGQAYGLLLWPIAVVYAAFFRPESFGDWALYSRGAVIALGPPIFLGYLIGREHEP